MPNRNYEVCPSSSEIMSCAHTSDFYLFEGKGEVKPMHPNLFPQTLGQTNKNAARGIFESSDNDPDTTTMWTLCVASNIFQ